MTTGGRVSDDDYDRPPLTCLPRTVYSPEPDEPKPVLYKADETPLYLPPKRIGFSR